MAKEVKVAVVGAGIIGLSTAVCVQKQCEGSKVTLISDEFSPNTTGDGAAGLWGPYLLGTTPPEKIEKWSGETHNLFRNLWSSERGGESGICMIPCTRVTKENEFPDPAWKNVVYGFRKLSKKELSSVRIPNLTFGSEFVTFTCEPIKLLPILLKQFKENGGIVLKQRVHNLKKLGEDFDIVINCTGLMAHHVVPDKNVQPKRGQVIRVEAPEITRAILDESDDGNYVIPNQDSVVMGGTHQEGDWNCNEYPEDTKFIKDGCYTIYPSLKNAKILKTWVGLRPGRPSVRLEMEKIEGKKPFCILHNYGHGGSGITLFWGCALEASELVQEAIKTTFKSKL